MSNTHLPRILEQIDNSVDKRINDILIKQHQGITV